jgi:hypothetical protein
MLRILGGCWYQSLHRLPLLYPCCRRIHRHKSCWLRSSRLPHTETLPPTQLHCSARTGTTHRPGDAEREIYRRLWFRRRLTSRHECVGDFNIRSREERRKGARICLVHPTWISLASSCIIVGSVLAFRRFRGHLGREVYGQSQFSHAQPTRSRRSH